VVLPDVQVGRELFVINFYDWLWIKLEKIPYKEGVVGKKIEERLKRAVEFINFLPQIDFVISIGDLTDSGTPEQLKRVAEICSKIRHPFIPMIGNHDVWPYQRVSGKKEVVWEAIKPLTVEEFESYFSQEWKRYVENFKAQGKVLQNYSFEIRGVKFIIADNNNRRRAPKFFGLYPLPGQAGWRKLYAETKEWIENEILNCENKVIVIFSHASLDIPFGELLCGLLFEPREFLSELKESFVKKLSKIIPEDKVVINISGHAHKRNEKITKNIRIFIVNALYHEPLIPIFEIFNDGKVNVEYYKI
jgi:predicted phosphodiesterase